MKSSEINKQFDESQWGYGKNPNTESVNSQAIKPKPGQKVAFYARFANPPVDVPLIRKTAIYCRTASTHPNDFGAILLQRDKLRTFANQHGYSICEEYMDDGFSGLNFERPAFQKLVADIESGLIGTVIVTDSSRISRNWLDFANWLERCKRKETSVKFVSALDDTGMQHSLCKDIQDGFAQILKKHTLTKLILE